MADAAKSKRILFTGAIALATLVGFLCLREDDSKCAGPMRTAEIKLANRTVTACGFPEEASTNQSLSVRGTLPYVLAATGRVDKVIREEVIASGARVIGVLSGSTFLIECDSAALAKLSHHPCLAAAAEFLPEDKIDPRLRKRVEGGADAVDVTVLSLAPADRDGLRTWVESQSGEVLKGCLNGDDSVTVRVPVALLGDLARRGDVRWLEAFTRPKLMNDMAVEPAAMNVREVWDTHGLTGKGQIITTSDSGIDTGDMQTIHPDFRKNLCGFGVVPGADAYDSDGHGTHTAGSIVGDGTMSDGDIRGVAYGAKVWAWFCNGGEDIFLPKTCEELFRPDNQNWPAYIHSASWGDDNAGAYDNQASVIDADIWRHPDFLMVVAAGNAGTEGSMTVGSPATAKNVLSVGATQNTRTWDNSWASGEPAVTAEYSSRGPCRDGRIKPDIAAPGTAVLSTAAAGLNYYYGSGENTNYAYSCGTSMATPLTAGAVALVREWLVTEGGFTNETPTAALMKAVITGGAKGTDIPNLEQGWGRVDLAETLYPSNRAVKLVDRIPFAMNTNFTYLIQTTNTAPLDVQLVWIDYPSAAGGVDTAPRIVNNLNLTVNAITNGVPILWHGNGGTTADDCNTVESVRITEAPAGLYLITVDCENIVFDHEDGGAAALYIRGAFDPSAEVSDSSDIVTITVGVEPVEVQSGSLTPSFGLHRVLRGTKVDFSADAYAYQCGALGTPCVRHRITGFTGTVDIPASGTAEVSEEGMRFSSVISNDSSIVWQYTTEPTDCRFTLFFSLDDVQGGCQIFLDEWKPINSSLTLSFPEDAPHGDGDFINIFDADPETGERMPVSLYFKLGAVLSYETDEIPGNNYLFDSLGRMPNKVTLKMDRGMDVYCRYYRVDKMTEYGLPYWWAMRYLGSRSDEDQTASADPDGDGFSNAAEYADGTDPADDESFRFKIDSFALTNMTFMCSVKGEWIVETSKTLNDDWKFVVGNDAPRTSTTNCVALPSEDAGSGFYRVRHQKKQH